MTVTIEKLQQMLKLQDKMNSVINPDWRNAGNAWYRAAWVEAAELMDHIGWKWWRKKTPNMVQAHIELADIWHFLLSQAIIENLTADMLIHSFEEEALKCLTNELGDDLSPLILIEHFVSSLLDEGRFFDYYGQFYLVCIALKLDFDELYRLYVGKNVLNIFRQDHGYKEGTYIKEWKSLLEPNGLIEDNVYLEMFMEEALRHKPADIYGYLYNKLETQYAYNL